MIVRRGAAKALGRFGPEGKKAIPALIDALTDPDNNNFVNDRVCELAAVSLELIGLDEKTREEIVNRLIRASETAKTVLNKPSCSEHY